MSKPIRLKLTAPETDAFYYYLQQVTKTVKPTTLAGKVIRLNMRRVLERLHVKSMASSSANLILKEEHALSLTDTILRNPVPPDWTFIANVLRLVTDQLPRIDAELLQPQQLLSHE